MIKIGRRGIFKHDVKDVYFDNEDYEITVFLEHDKHLRCDEITIYCDNAFQYYWNVFKVRIKLLIF